MLQTELSPDDAALAQLEQQAAAAQFESEHSGHEHGAGCADCSIAEAAELVDHVHDAHCGHISREDAFVERDHVHTEHCGHLHHHHADHEFDHDQADSHDTRPLFTASSTNQPADNAAELQQFFADVAAEVTPTAQPNTIERGVTPPEPRAATTHEAVRERPVSEAAPPEPTTVKPSVIPPQPASRREGPSYVPVEVAAESKIRADDKTAAELPKPTFVRQADTLEADVASVVPRIEPLAEEAYHVAPLDSLQLEIENTVQDTALVPVEAVERIMPTITAVYESNQQPPFMNDAPEATELLSPQPPEAAPEQIVAIAQQVVEAVPEITDVAEAVAILEPLLLVWQEQNFEAPAETIIDAFVEALPAELRQQLASEPDELQDSMRERLQEFRQAGRFHDQLFHTSLQQLLQNSTGYIRRLGSLTLFLTQRLAA